MQNVPDNVSFLAQTPNYNIELTEIDIFYDAKTQHSTISNFQKNEYYEDYLMTTTYSESMQKLQAHQVDKLSKLVELEMSRKGRTDELGLNSFRFIEVGCGDGSFLEHASTYFKEVVGIEPSRKFWDLCQAKNLDVINDYLTSDNLLTNRKFDAFASRQVFEHLENPKDTLIGLRKILNDDAIGFIEVPNGYKALKNGNFYEFFPDHINYFSLNSLSALVNDVGFNIIESKQSFNSDYLEIWIQNSPAIDIENQQFDRTKLKIDIALQNYTNVRRSGRKSVFFGCGAKAISLVTSNSEFFTDNFEFAIDSDPNKIGKFIPNTAIEILSINDPRLRDYEEILILALSYQNEINNLIQEKLVGVHSIYSMGQDNVLTRLFSSQ